MVYMEMRNKFIYIIFMLLFLGCESTLSPPEFEVYLCPVTDVDVTLKNSSNLTISWTYPDGSIQDICDDNADSFIINYIISDEELTPSYSDFGNGDFTPIPFELEQSNNYSYDFPITDPEKFYYFSIDVKYFDDYSAAHGEGSYVSGLGVPTVSYVQNCDNVSEGLDYDDDCLQCTISNNTLNIVDDYSNLFLNEEIINSQGNIVRTQSIQINQEDVDAPIVRNLFLDYTNQEMGTDISDLYGCDGVDPEFLCPNTSYEVKYYYTQTIDGIEHPLNPTCASCYSNSYTFSFVRNENINIASKPISDDEFRIYIENVFDLQYYDYLYIWTLDNNQLNAIEVMQNITDNKTSYVFDNYIHVDIANNQNDNDYYVSLVGNENHYGVELSINTLNIPGFRLIEQVGVLDYYMSTYEVTQNDINNDMWTAIQGDFPAEVNKNGCENYISVLSNIYSAENYSFRIPTNSEWEYAAGKNIYLNSETLYPWGNTMQSDYANYFNSDYPLLFSGENDISEVGYFNNYTSPFGLHDMSGNLSEWVSYSNNYVGKGGNYLLGQTELEISQILDDIIVPGFSINTEVGMGCRIILETN